MQTHSCFYFPTRALILAYVCNMCLFSVLCHLPNASLYPLTLFASYLIAFLLSSSYLVLPYSTLTLLRDFAWSSFASPYPHLPFPLTISPLFLTPHFCIPFPSFSLLTFSPPFTHTHTHTHTHTNTHTHTHTHTVPDGGYGEDEDCLNAEDEEYRAVLERMESDGKYGREPMLRVNTVKFIFLHVILLSTNLFIFSYDILIITYLFTNLFFFLTFFYIIILLVLF